MSIISTVDKNFLVRSGLEQKGIKWLPSYDDSFTIYGLMKDENGYKRMNAEDAKKANPGVYKLHRMTSGGRIVFETNSPYIAINVKADLFPMGHMTYLGTFGFDIYEDRGEGFKYLTPLVPPVDCMKNGKAYECLRIFRTPGVKKLMLHFPLYGFVDELYIGFDENSYVKKLESHYEDKKPLVFYGSSVTQGACATRPGNCYPPIVSLKSNIDFINLGFSGSAGAEKELAEYIANIPMSAFIMEYDYNDCQTPELVRQKHYPFYKIIRDKNPDLPIIMMSLPITTSEPWYESRLCVIESYEKAKANGDNVYFVDGLTVFDGEFYDCATTDGCHPNDYGYIRIAKEVLKGLKSTGVIE